MLTGRIVDSKISTRSFRGRDVFGLNGKAKAIETLPSGVNADCPCVFCHSSSSNDHLTGRPDSRLLFFLGHVR